MTAPQTEAPLTPEQEAAYERDGYLVLDSPGWSEAELDGAVADLDGKYGRDNVEEGGVVYKPHRVQDAWRISENVRALALHPRILAILEQLYGRRPLPFQTLNFHRGTQQAAHADAVHFNTMPPGFMAGVWIALEDMDMDNGPLVYYPGSHKLPYIHPKDLGVPPRAWDEYPKYIEYVQQAIEREGFQPEYGTISKGSALIWSANLLHGGIKREDESRSRHSQVTHYFFDGCRYYTPWASDPEAGDVTWRNPTWVS